MNKLKVFVHQAASLVYETVNTGSVSAVMCLVLKYQDILYLFSFVQSLRGQLLWVNVISLNVESLRKQSV